MPLSHEMKVNIMEQCFPKIISDCKRNPVAAILEIAWANEID